MCDNEVGLTLSLRTCGSESEPRPGVVNMEIVGQLVPESVVDRNLGRPKSVFQNRRW